MKKNIFKKIFIKISKILGYEIIDQNEFYSPTLEKSVDENLSNLNKSIVLPLGEVKLTRKINSILILFRTNTNVEIWDQNKKRIFEFPKIEYTLRTINSVVNSCNVALKIFNNLKINLIVTDDLSTEVNLLKIQKTLDKANFSSSILKIKKDEFLDEIKKKDENNNPISENMISNMRNILKSIDPEKTRRHADRNYHRPTGLFARRAAIG